MNRELDYRPLSGRVTLRDRLTVIAGNPMYVMGGTVLVLVVIVPLVVFFALLAAGKAWDDGGVVALLAMLFVGGVFGVGSLLREAGKGGALEKFAHGNKLDLVRASGATHYAGSLFADGSHVVQRSVRTRGSDFLEVGDRFPLKGPKARYSPRLDIVQADQVNQPELFLRGRIAGRVRFPDTVRVEGDLHERLTRFAGEYTIERSGNELTVFGSRRLDSDKPGRVEEAFALLRELVAQSNATLPAGEDTEAPPYHVRAGAGGREPKKWGPLRMVGVTLGLLIVLPPGFAFVMSILDNASNHRVVAVIAVLGFIGFAGKAFESLLRSATNDDGRKKRRWPWLLGAVAFVALGVYAVSANQTDTSNDDLKASADECSADDTYCQWDVSARVWGEEHGLERVGEFDWAGCYLEGPVSECPIRVECDDGYADLVAVYEGEPYEVVGVRAPDTKPRNPLRRPPVRSEDSEIERLVAKHCRPR